MMSFEISFDIQVEHKDSKNKKNKKNQKRLKPTKSVFF